MGLSSSRGDGLVSESAGLDVYRSVDWTNDTCPTGKEGRGDRNFERRAPLPSVLRSRKFERSARTAARKSRGAGGHGSQAGQGARSAVSAAGARGGTELPVHLADLRFPSGEEAPR